MMEEYPELTSSHGHTASVTTHETISAKKIYENKLSNSFTPSKQEKSHIEVGGEAEMQSLHKPHSWHSDPQLGGNTNSELLPEEQWSYPTLGTLTFKTCT